MSALRSNSILTKLTLCGVNAGGIAKLATVFHEIPTLKTLELQCDWIGSDGAKQLGKCYCSRHCGITADTKKVADCIVLIFL